MPPSPRVRAEKREGEGPRNSLGAGVLSSSGAALRRRVSTAAEFCRPPLDEFGHLPQVACNIRRKFRQRSDLFCFPVKESHRFVHTLSTGLAAPVVPNFLELGFGCPRFELAEPHQKLLFRGLGAGKRQQHPASVGEMTINPSEHRT